MSDRKFIYFSKGKGAGPKPGGHWIADNGHIWDELPKTQTPGISQSPSIPYGCARCGAYIFLGDVGDLRKLEMGGLMDPTCDTVIAHRVLGE